MNDETLERVTMLANHILSTHDTIRKTAKVFSLSKSTVHNDVSKRLYKIDRVLYLKVQKILDEHFREKHIRGGEATRKKYKDLLESLNKKLSSEQSCSNVEYEEKE